MTSFQLSVSPSRRAAARFVNRVRRSLQKAYAEQKEIKQTDIAEALDVHRSVITRQMRGYRDMSLGRVAEIAWALGLEPEFNLRRSEIGDGANQAPVVAGALQLKTGTGHSDGVLIRPHFGGVAATL